MFAEASLSILGMRPATLSGLLSYLINYGLNWVLANFVEVGKLKVSPKRSRTTSACSGGLQLTSYRKLHQLARYSIHCKEGCWATWHRGVASSWVSPIVAVLGQLWAPFLLFRVFLSGYLDQLSRAEPLSTFINFLRSFADDWRLDLRLGCFDWWGALAFFWVL